MVKELRKEWTAATKNNRESFMYQGREYHTQYAKYLLEYLDQHFTDKA